MVGSSDAFDVNAAEMNIPDLRALIRPCPDLPYEPHVHSSLGQVCFILVTGVGIFVVAIVLLCLLGMVEEGSLHPNPVFLCFNHCGGLAFLITATIISAMRFFVGVDNLGVTHQSLLRQNLFHGVR